MIHDLKPYPAMKDSGVPWLGEVPEHWEVKRGKALFRCIDVRSSTGDEELLTVSSERGVVPRSSATVTMFKADSYIGYKLCWPGDLVINSLWAWGRGLGVSQHHGIVSSAYGVYRLRPRFAEYAAYIHQLVRSTPFNWELQVRSKGIWISRLQLTDEAFLGAPFPLPPPDEQTAIVRFLDYADRRIRRYIRAKQKLIKLLEEQVASRASEAMRHPACTHDRLGRVVRVHVRPITRDDAESYVALGLYNRGRGIFHKPPTLGAELGVSTFSWVEPGDLIISGQFAWEGAVALASSAEERTIVSHRYHLLRGINDRTTTPYLWALFRSDFGAMLLDQHSRGAAGRNRPLNLRALLKEPVPIPPYELQVGVDNEVAATAPLRTQAARAIELLREFRARLFADVVTGKLDVREAAARLPDDAEEPEALDEIDDESQLDETGVDDIDEMTEEGEA
ncbi:MAG TPA: restriction endonuclease subunit S [Verrucomicrobiota bacterium]|nr:restriction endonuclease subunit S [Verrucomicrobiota bacterium]